LTLRCEGDVGMPPSCRNALVGARHGRDVADCPLGTTIAFTLLAGPCWFVLPALTVPSGPVRIFE